MLGEKNLYAYCDDNPIMRVDGDGQFFWIGGLIGAAVNVVTGGIAASVTGQRYTIVDMVAAVSGFFAGGLTCFSPGIVSMIGGCISGSYAVYCSLKRGGFPINDCFKCRHCFWGKFIHWKSNWFFRTS